MNRLVVVVSIDEDLQEPDDSDRTGPGGVDLRAFAVINRQGYNGVAGGDYAVRAKSQWIRASRLDFVGVGGWIERVLSITQAVICCADQTLCAESRVARHVILAQVDRTLLGIIAALVPCGLIATGDCLLEG